MLTYTEMKKAIGGNYIVYHHRRASYWLSLVTTASAIYYGLRKYVPERQYEYTHKFPYFTLHKLEDFVTYLIEYAGYLFPVQEDYTYECWLEGGIEPPRFQLEAQGPCWSWDDYGDALETKNFAEPYVMFFMILDHHFDSDSYHWEYYNQIYGWNCREPSWTRYVDIEIWDKRVKQKGLEDIRAVHRWCDHASDSIFLRWNPYDETQYNHEEAFFELTKKTVDYAVEHWQLAQKELKQKDEGVQRLIRDNSLYQKYLDVLDGCAMKGEDWYAKYRPGEPIPPWV